VNEFNKVKKILILPFLAFLVIAFINLVFGLAFGFVTWIVLGVLIALVSFPIILGTKDTEVPIMQIFTSLFVVYLFFSIAAYMDFKTLLGYPSDQALVYGFLSGFLLIAAVMILKGK